MNAFRKGLALLLLGFCLLGLAARPLGLTAIALYQRYASPYKGFDCAYGALTRGQSCSEFGKQAVAEHGLLGGVHLLQTRFDDCAWAAARIRQLQRQADGSWQCQGTHCNGNGTFKCW